MKFNFKKISAVLASGVMALSGIGFAAAATYPAPFVSGGSADVAIVHGTGEGVSSMDQSQAYILNIDLQSYMTGTGTTTSTSTTATGDYVILEKSSDKLNIGDTWSSTFTGSVTDDELPTLLASGTYRADDNDEFTYEQKINLGAATTSPNLTHFRDSDYESLIGVNVKTPVVGFKITNNMVIMNYTLDFLTDVESDVVGSNMDDIIGSDLPLLGRDYYVSDFDIGNDFFGAVTLLDTANTRTVNEGETVNVITADTSYDVSISYIDSSNVKFVVNGETVPKSGKLTSGSSYKLDSGAYLGVKDISKLEVSGEIGSSTFSIGSGKLVIASGAAATIKKNDVTVDGLTAWVKNSSSKLDSIVIEWRSDGDTFLTPGAELVMPGFEAIKFSMNDLIRSPEEKITVAKSNDQEMAMEVPIKDGIVDIALLYGEAVEGNFTGIGKAVDEQLVTTSGNELIFWERNASALEEDAYFVATYNVTGEGESYKLRASVTEEKDNSRNVTTIQKQTNDGTTKSWVDVCSKKTNGNTCNIGDVSLTINTVEKNSTSKWVNITAGTSVDFNTIVTNGGMQITLPYESNTVGNGQINFSDAAPTTGHGQDNWYLYFYSEDKDDSIRLGTSTYATIDNTATFKFEVSQINGAGTGGSLGLENEVIEDGAYEFYVADAVGTRFVHYTSDNEDYLEVYYPTGDSQTYAEVLLTEGDSVISGGVVTPGGVGQLGEILIKDTEVAPMSTKNMIIVGGSCINSAAAKVLGVAQGTCGADFTTATGVGAGEFLIKGVTGAYSTGKLALVVAGYNVDDTVNAVTYLKNKKPDTSKAWKGTTAAAAATEITAA